MVEFNFTRQEYLLEGFIVFYWQYFHTQPQASLTFETNLTCLGELSLAMVIANEPFMLEGDWLVVVEENLSEKACKTALAIFITKSSI